MQIDVKKLTPELSGDFLRFFDNDAFSDNPDWAECYCCFFYFDDGEWSRRTAEMNRSHAKKAIKHGDMHGYLAYIEDEPVGWINADDKNAYARLEKDGGQEKVLSIVCFTVTPWHRRKGIAAKLLQAALDGAKKDGYDFAEAYPAKGAETDAHHYHGPLELYTKNGFEVISEEEDKWVVRKKL